MQHPTTQHRDEILDAVAALAPTIRAAGDRIEAERRVPDEIVQGLADAGVLRMMLPRRVGGDELDPASAFAVIEALSRIDGSVGWVAMIAAGTPAFVVPWLPDDVTYALLGQDLSRLMVGALAPRGRAVAVDSGYRVSGRWPFGSGCEHARWLASGAVVHDGDTPRLDERGQPVRRLVLLPQESCTIHDTWHVAGLRGTGSHDYSADDLFVPHEHAVDHSLPKHHDRPLYAVKFLLIAHAAHALGVARHALDAFQEQAARGGLRERPLAQLRLAQAEALVSSSRTYVLSAVDDAWQTANAGVSPSIAQRAAIRLAITNAVQSAAEAVRLLYDAAGGASIYTSSPLERLFRDIHVTTQHAVVATPSYELLGRALLGFETDADGLL